MAVEYAKPIKWNIRTSSGASYSLKVNYSLLNSSSFYRNNVSNACQKWNSTPTKIFCSVESNYDVSNVDIVTANQTFWNSIKGIQPNTLAITYHTDTNGYTFNSYDGSRSSTGLIKHGTIYVNPNNDSHGLDENHQIGVIVHEIGHVLGLWHNSSENSVMYAITNNSTQYVSQSLDITDINNKYK